MSSNTKQDFGKEAESPEGAHDEIIIPASDQIEQEILSNATEEDIASNQEIASSSEETAPLARPGVESERVSKSQTKPLSSLPTEATASSTGKNGASAQRQPLFQVAQRCHVGAVRHRNEDSSFVFQSDSGGQIPMQPFGLYIVADGMGGHFAGHEASRLSSRLVAHQVLQSLFAPMLSVDNQNFEPVHEVMSRAVQEANRQIYNPDPEKDMGTTLTAALILGKRLYLAHVGDSRAYLYRDGELKTLTVDHTYVRRLQDAGQLTEDEAAEHDQRHILYKAVGQGGELEVDLFTQSLPANGMLLICSDGLWGMIPHEKLISTLEEPLSLDKKIESLINQSLENGGDDNITGILVKFAY